MALPTFFIIGAPKAGTTSLHLYLDRHPEIQMSANKEPRFFAGPEDGVPYAPGRVSRLPDYEALFDPTVAMRGEASTDYATHPRRRGAPGRIKELVPGARFLYLVRDPVARTISHYRMRAAFLGERRPIEQALGDFTDRRSPYIWPSLYASQLERYFEHFSQDRVLVIDQADLLADRRRTLNEIFSFLSVDAAAESLRVDEQLSDSSDWRAYSPTYTKLVDRLVAPCTRWIPQHLRRATRRAVEARIWPALDTPALDEQLLQRLNELYRPQAERLRALTGKAFSSWAV